MQMLVWILGGFFGVDGARRGHNNAAGVASLLASLGAGKAMHHRITERAPARVEVLF